MLLTSPIIAAIFVACTSTVSADFDKFHFASNATEYVCPGIGFGCIPPMICAHESLTDQYYCCGPGASDAVCWKGSPECDGGNDKTPSGSQQSCSSGDNAFCCLKTREECTATKNQINICWSTVENPIANLSETKLNDTFSSLSSAHPSATSFAVSLAQLQSTATSSSSLSSTSASATTSSTSTSASSTSTSTSTVVNETKGISGGAIGGIVGGVVGGLALIGIIGFLLFRRRKAGSKGKHEPIVSGSPSVHDEHGNPYELNAYHQQHVGMAEAPVPVEKYANSGGAGSAGPVGPYRDVPEVQGSSVQRPEVFEVQGSGPMEMDGSTPVRR